MGGTVKLLLSDNVAAWYYTASGGGYSGNSTDIQVGLYGVAPNSYDNTTAIWFETYDSSLLDSMTEISNFVLRFVPRQNMSAGFQVKLLSSSITPSSGKQTIYDAIKAATALYTTGSAVNAESDVIVPITSLSDMKALIDNPVGLYLTSGSVYLYDKADGTKAPYLEFDYLDQTDIPPEVSITYPTAETVIVNNDVTFTWTYTQAGSSPQTHYDLDYSTNGIVWMSYANQVASAVSECVITAGTLSSRVYYWRVRSYSLDMLYVSEYAQASFVAIVNPATTDVTCDGMPMPTVGWTASEQQAFQIKFGTYETGTIYSAAGSYKIPYCFDDGAYITNVRTQNNLGIWSAWTADVAFTIANVPGDAITLTAAQSGNAVNLMWTTAGTYEKYYIYRDNVPIAETDDAAYADNFANGAVTYTVRGILANEYYTLSNEAETDIVLTYDVVSAVGAIEWIPLKYSLGQPISTYSQSDEMAYLRFAGRPYPIPASDGFRNRRGGYSYAFKTRAEIDALMVLSGSMVIHKDTKGNRTIGIINDFSVVYTGKFYYTVSFNITVTDYAEAVDYD